LEAFLIGLLHSSVLDSALHTLEAKAGGLFIFAKLLQDQLQDQAKAGAINFSSLGDLPSGLDGIYASNFLRIFPTEVQWSSCKAIVAMIVVASEPLPADIVERILGECYSETAAAMSLLFPVREGRFQVMHKSVVDWLRDQKRLGQLHCVEQKDLDAAHRQLATELLSQSRQLSSVPGMSEASKSLGKSELFSLRHAVAHLKEANMLASATELLLDFQWLLLRAKVRQAEGLLQDGELVSNNIPKGNFCRLNKKKT
jgi:hypothetical protein